MKMENNIRLTDTQEKVFYFLKEYLKEKGFPPTLREIAGHFGLNGPKGPQKTLSVLERKGYLRRVPGGSRAIEVLGPKADRQRNIRRMDDMPAISIPIVGRVRAGEPILAIENVEGYLKLDRSFASSGDVFLLRVQGDICRYIHSHNSHSIHCYNSYMVHRYRIVPYHLQTNYRHNSQNRLRSGSVLQWHVHFLVHLELKHLL